MPTYLAISMSVVAGLALLRWALEVRWKIAVLDEVYWMFWLPLVVPIVPVYVWLQPKLRLLKKPRNRARHSAFAFAWLTITLPAIFAVHQVPRVFGDIVSVETIAEFEYTPNIRYVALNSTILDVTAQGEYASDDTTYRRGRARDYAMRLHYVHPFVESPHSGHTRYWRGIKFYRRMDASATDAEKAQAFERLREFAASELVSTGHRLKSYYEVVPPSGNLDYYRGAIASVAGANVAKHAIVLELQQNSRPAGFGQAAKWILQAWAVGIGIYLLVIAMHGIRKKMENRNSRSEVYPDRWTNDN